MVALNPSGLNVAALNGGPPVNMTGFAGVVTGVITWGTHIVFTDASTFPSGDSFGKIQIQIYDNHGGEVMGAITTASGTVTIATDSTLLNQLDNYIIKATVTSTKGCIADGSVIITPASATCTVGNYALSFTTTVF